MADGHRTTDHLEEFRRSLAQARCRLARTLAATDDELATLEAHQPGAPTEDASRELTEAVLSRVEGREKHELDEIDAAQARLEAGTYGVCEVCAAAIPLARLRAVATARCCVGCQTELEERLKAVAEESA
jgi:RNA polymerase-binding transcription factor